MTWLTVLAILPPSPIQVPLFAARIVPVALRARSWISEARRDLTAVGGTEDFGVDWRAPHPVVVIRGQPIISRNERDGDARFAEAVAILPRDRFVVAFSGDLTRWSYRAARASDGRWEPSEAIETRPRVARFAPSTEEITPFPPRLWPNAPLEGYRFEPSVSVSWWRLPGSGTGGLEVGTGVAFPEDPARVYEFGPEIGVSFLRRPGGTIRPLSSSVTLPSGVWLGKIVWVSREGWMVATTISRDARYRGLVWLDPIRLPARR